MIRRPASLRRLAKVMAVGLGLLGGLAAMDARAGLAIDRTPLDPEFGSRTANEHRTFIVVGCVPQNLPAGRLEEPVYSPGGWLENVSALAEIGASIS